ncbi:hypothetical protein CFC21_030933 [Triticum aestivum]|uniref:Uncharacterized protein n=2 Tax=Triticum aestivum TaxID=4565 RepID=A0A9R1JHV0_WHEAT|nr:uncharacterized protein LOC123054005 [Triticum aestivum]KAF7017497.1 hypothetical protein CFC21_030933 [Triticum aestivum]
MSSSSSAGSDNGGSTETIQREVRAVSTEGQLARQGVAPPQNDCKARRGDIGGETEEGVAAENAEVYDLTEGWGENDPAECEELLQEIESEPAGHRLFHAVAYTCAWASWDDDDEVDSVACKRPKLC